MDEPKDRLKRAREQAGYATPAEAARAVRSINQNTITSNENGNRPISRKMAQVYGVAFGVSPGWLLYGDTAPDKIPVTGIKVAGTAQAGAFRDITMIDDDYGERETVPAPQDPRYAHARQYALRLEGGSMNKRFPDGSMVICAVWADVGRELKPGMSLHVERTQGPLVEVTVKIYAERNGRRWLDPDSSDKRFKPIELNGDDDTEIVVKGLVIGSYRPEPV